VVKAMAAQRVILTYRDYETLPDDGRLYELHEGELWVTPAPTPQHQRVSRHLFRPIDQHVTARRLGEVFFSPIDVILSDTTVIQPDLVFLDTTQIGRISSRGIEGPPTLAIQVLSRSTAQINRTIHLHLFAKHGVPFYWIADPETRAIEVYVLREGGYDLHVRATGPDPVILPPFPDLPIIPDSIWP
jgi:Uma2 family endonuclease